MADLKSTLQGMISAYIPLDRRLAFISNHPLDGRRQGSALFADISGSTAMAESLVETLGPIRGADEVSRQLNRVYDALVECVHGYRGSVIGFSGDAITCWFDSDSGLAATACALAMQEAMGGLPAYQDPTGRSYTLGIKVSISAGEILRTIVGDPARQVFDLIAGSPLERLARGEHLANVGEVIVSQEVCQQLRGQLEVTEWREDGQDSSRFGRISGLSLAVEQSAVKLPDLSLVDLSLLRPWVSPLVFERLRSGRGEFLAELRPATALFLRFLGLDFQGDPKVTEKLDRYVRLVQEVIDSYDGSLIQLTVGDKGSYLYIAFGAPRAHEDDTVRAVSAAIELGQRSIEFVGPVSIGISHGRMRTGAYGSRTMRTYGVLGDDTNLAARLMQHAAPGAILVSSSAQELAADDFEWAHVEKLKVKGKREPIAAFSPTGVTSRGSLVGKHAQATLPLIGRHEEINQLEAMLKAAGAGSSQLVGISGEAGMGKSRLAVEIMRRASELGFTAFLGECQAYGGSRSYHVWRGIWRGIFGISRQDEIHSQLGQLEHALNGFDPSLQPRIPLLSPLLNLPIPDNDLTSGLDAKLRKRSLESMLGEILKSASAQQPVLVVLEDVQWIDSLSIELLQSLSRTARNHPVMFMLLFRSEEGAAELEAVRSLDKYQELELREIDDDETEQLIRLKVRSLVGNDIEPPRALIGRVCTTAQGNPFYIEELLNYLHSQQVDLADEKALDQIELPSSLISLILSRIDLLDESARATLHLASVIGRSFRADWVTSAFTQIQDDQRARADLEQLEQFDLTRLENPEPDLSYIFKQILTREVAYESLPFDTRAVLHDQLGSFIEARYASNIDPYIETLAHHFSQSENTAKQRIYLLQAGERAQASYANQAALDYYTRVLSLLAGKERLEVQLQLAQVLELVGEWPETERVLLEGLDRAEANEDATFTARYQAELGEFHRKQGSYEEAASWLEKARQMFESSQDEAGQGQVLHYEGTLAAQQGDYAAASDKYQRSLSIRRALNDQDNIANLLNNLGILARYQGRLDQARQFQTQSLELRRKLGDRWAIAVSLNNLGNLALDQGELDLARDQLSEALKVQREIGDLWAVAVFADNLANAVRARGELEAASALYRESLLINRQLGDQWALAYLLEDIGCLATLQECHREALLLTFAAEALRESIGAPRSESEERKLQQQLARAQSSLSQDTLRELEAQGRALEPEEAIELALHLPTAGHESPDARRPDEKTKVR